jgi:hypothetical protein
MWFLKNLRPDELFILMVSRHFIIYIWVYQTVFETNSATPGKIFEYYPLYPAQIHRGGLKIITENPKAKGGKIVGASAMAAHADVYSMITRRQETYEDARGFTYTSVRFCDLDRICDK